MNNAMISTALSRSAVPGERSELPSQLCFISRLVDCLRVWTGDRLPPHGGAPVNKYDLTGDCCTANMRTTEHFLLRELHSDCGPVCYTGLTHVTCMVLIYLFIADLEHVLFKLFLSLSFENSNAFVRVCVCEMKPFYVHYKKGLVVILLLQDRGHLFKRTSLWCDLIFEGFPFKTSVL